MKNQTRAIYAIAQEINNDWTNMSPTAKPYVDAMFSCSDITDKYIHSTARSMVAYFLANAQTWRGETARRVKIELKEMLNGN